MMPKELELEIASLKAAHDEAAAAHALELKTKEDDRLLALLKEASDRLKEASDLKQFVEHKVEEHRRVLARMKMKQNSVSLPMTHRIWLPSSAY